MSTKHRPDFKFNITGCLEKYGDVREALKWLTRAEKELTDKEFIVLMDESVGNEYRSKQLFSEIFALRDQKSIILYGMKDIKALLESYFFDEADQFYIRNKDYINGQEYKKLEQEYQEKQHNEKFANTFKDIKALLESYQFDEADKFYINNKDYINELEYMELRQDYQEKQRKEITAKAFRDTEAFLESYRFKEADKLYNKNKEYLNETEYSDLRQTYIEKQRIDKLKMNILSNFNMNEQEALSLSKIVIQNRVLSGDMTWEKLKAFTIRNMKEIVFPRSIYFTLLEDISGDIKKGVAVLDEDTLTVLMKMVLGFRNKRKTECKNIWTVFETHPAILKKLSSFQDTFLEELADTYPLENFVKFSHFYLPPEPSCLTYLRNGQVPLDEESYAKVKSSFQKNRYFNCEMVLALLKAKDEHRKITVKDILDDLLKEIVNRAFNYNLSSKRPIPNLIFPGCISDYKSRNFQIPHSNLIFCEGRQLKRRENGEIYMLCRNRQCNERTELLNFEGGIQSGNYFFNFLREEFGIPIDEISLNKDFVQAMGAFNRWNEIAERLVCGYGKMEGCGSPLIFSKTPQVNPGRAAYATTYWRCSNPVCKNVKTAIKMSHCAGCHKIIDSRFDKVSCNRRDGKEFFICMDCGYCCDEHKVSGTCPKCGQNKGWDKHDEYGKRYRCAACDHEIAVSGLHKHCLDADGANRGTEINKPKDFTLRKDMLSNHGKVPFDDIPF